MKTVYFAVAAMGITLAACSQPEPEPVYVQPTYDKFGTPSCSVGYDLATLESGALVCAPLPPA
ncbi:hypothetical protein [Marinibacterium profundimaris]|uniref:Lipoprotein n=1 Tax=Marinibacterium profundimaris TaxID=1679460 RepID=A0A225NIE7_9RHOB|nr:hypothetical protein [Marinibacterium profundimaris]OWU73586.1 hypothetical protein ATO3_13120 [Marinibacterium profundimaris]